MAGPLRLIALAVVVAVATASRVLLEIPETTIPETIPNKRVFAVRGAAARGDANANGNSANGKVTCFAGSSTNPIKYHGGPVLLNTVNVYHIFYGDTWSQDTLGQQVLNNLASNIGGSGWYNIQTTYTSGTGVRLSNSVRLAGTISMSDALYGKSLSDQNITNIVSTAVTAYSLPTDTNAVYFVLGAPDVTATSGFCTQYCGWHNYAVINGATLKYAFVGNAATQCVGACIAQTTSISGSLGADGMASVLAHELAEAATDPQLNAWYDCRGMENADKCAWTFGTTYTTSSGAQANINIGGQDYLIQQNWVNSGTTGSGFCALKY